uniref:Uncharacterized protein n=1 Tax=Anguilla anguilla TaxID=7936 RepID=A0A0E9S483_ANGAN
MDCDLHSILISCHFSPLTHLTLCWFRER